MARLKSASPPGKPVPYARSEVHEHQRLAISANDAGYVRDLRSSVASSNFESLSNESLFQKTDLKKKTEKKKKALLRLKDNNDETAPLTVDNVKLQFRTMSSPQKKEYTMQVIQYYLDSTKGVEKKHANCKELKTLLSNKHRELKKELKQIEEKNSIEPKLFQYYSKLGFTKEVDDFMCAQNINKMDPRIKGVVKFVIVN